MIATVLNLWPDTKGVFMKKSLAQTVWECKYHNESVVDAYDSDIDADPFKGARINEEDPDI